MWEAVSRPSSNRHHTGPTASIFSSLMFDTNTEVAAINSKLPSLEAAPLQVGPACFRHSTAHANRSGDRLRTRQSFCCFKQYCNELLFSLKRRAWVQSPSTINYAALFRFWVSQIWRSCRGQHICAEIDKPYYGKTIFMIMVNPVRYVYIMNILTQIQILVCTPKSCLRQTCSSLWASLLVFPDPLEI